MIAPYLQMNQEIQETINGFKAKYPLINDYCVIKLAGNKYYYIVSDQYKELKKYLNYPFSWLYKGSKINETNKQYTEVIDNRETPPRLFTD